jgi:hypothetical protein
MENRTTTFDSSLDKDIFLFHCSKRPLGLIQSPIQCVPAIVSEGVRPEGRETGYSHRYITELKLYSLKYVYEVVLRHYATSWKQETR